MLFTVAQVVVIAFGAVICILSVWGMLAPKKLVRLVSEFMGRPSGMYGAVIARIVLGLALLGSAAAARYPHVFQVLGWIAIAAAIALPIIGRARLQRFVAWFDRCPVILLRLWLLFGVAFGAFLVYGVA